MRTRGFCLAILVYLVTGHAATRSAGRSATGTGVLQGGKEVERRDGRAYRPAETIGRLSHYQPTAKVDSLARSLLSLFGSAELRVLDNGRRFRLGSAGPMISSI